MDLPRKFVFFEYFLLTANWLLCLSGGPEEGGFEVTYHDVIPFGVVLLGLITKRIVDRENILKTTLVYRWAWRQYRPNRYLVHESLVEDPGFYASDGIMITELAMRRIQRELISVLPWRMLSSVWRGYKLFNFMAM